MANEKIWALYLTISQSQVNVKERFIEFDHDFWDYTLVEAKKAGINTIILEVADNVRYESHPEIAHDKSWDAAQIKKMVKQCRDLGIELVPLANFSTGHSHWMGEYRRMTSSKIYYEFCSDIIKDLYEMFDHPKYMHIGFDEEVTFLEAQDGYYVYRRGELLMHDFQFILDEVKKTGAQPWAWHDPLWEYAEDYFKYMDPKEDVVLCPWFYFAFKKEHYTPIPQYDADGSENEWYKEGYRYQEDVPFFKNATDYFYGNRVLEIMKHGFKYLPTSSIYLTDYNTDELMEFFKEGAPDDQIVGHIVAPWVKTIWESKEKIDRSLRLFAEAKKKHYGI